MEKTQSEVTNKIRSAIKQKLAEISEFVDDELPDYIMILVANQRSKSQIEKDLSLFLRSDTVNFTNWLWELLNNLKVGATANQSVDPKTELDIPEKIIDADEDAVVLDFDPDEHETDFLTPEDTNDSCISKLSVNPISLKTSEVLKEPPIKLTHEVKPVEKSSAKNSSPVKTPKKPPVLLSRDLPSAVVPVKRKHIDSEDEYDPAKPEYERTPYSSTSNPRKYRSNRNYSGPAALQANKLLLKAVNDAAKSILKGKSLEECYKPTPIKVLSKQYDKPLGVKMNNLSKKRNVLRETLPEPESKVKELEVPEYDELSYPSDVDMEEDTNDSITHSSIRKKSDPLQRSRTICLNSIPIEVDNLDFGNDSSNSPASDYNLSFEPVEEVQPKSPHFIVTLDGVSRNAFKSKIEENSFDSMEDEEDEFKELSADENIAEPEKIMKLNERCKYWPACKNSDQCTYHHPTVPCKSFPDCKFGDKCLYIHPNCKFDALCSRKDCPFTHASKRKIPFITVPVKMIPVQSKRMKVVCKFYPKCAAKNCPFIHPKLCRYGTDCRSPACLYGHFPVPSRSQMKWKATV